MRPGRLPARAVVPVGAAALVLAVAPMLVAAPARPDASHLSPCSDRSPIPVRELRAAQRSGCSLVGRAVTDGRVAVIVPPVGLSVSGDGMSQSGDVEGLTVSNTHGTVHVVRSGAHRSPDTGWYFEPLDTTPQPTSPDRVVGPTGLPLAAYAGSTAACGDRTFNLEGHRWYWRLHYAINLRHMPGRFRASTVVAQVKAANANMRSGRNTCGRPALATPRARYLGRTTARPDIRPAGPTCMLPGNDTNVVAFADLPNGLLGWTCYWFNGEGKMIGADMLLDNGPSLVTALPARCTDKWDFEGTVTHEWGHAYGLAHTGPGHPNLTMQHQLKPCSTYARTLGLGDWLGMKSLYGHR